MSDFPFIFVRPALAAGTLFLSFAHLAPAATTVLTVSKDTFLQTDGGSGHIVRGGINSPEKEQLWLYHNGGAWVARPLLHFDLTALAGETVAGDSQFTLTVAGTSGTSQRTIELVPLTSGFNPETATHNANGGSISGPSFATLNTVPVQNGTITFTIPAATVQAWIDSPETNHGFAIVPSVPTADVIFHSGDAAVASTHPTLSVTLIPEPSAALLTLLGTLGLLRRRR